MTNANANAKAKAKIGDSIVIKGFKGDEPSADKYIGKTGVVESIDDTGTIFGTWGGLGLLPEDDYEVLAEGETVHTFADCLGETVFILPRQFQDLINAVYTCANSNCDCTVDGISYIGC